MSWELSDLRDEQASALARPAVGAALCALRGARRLQAYVGAGTVGVRAHDERAHMRGRWSQLGVLLQVTGAGGSP